MFKELEDIVAEVAFERGLWSGRRGHSSREGHPGMGAEAGKRGQFGMGK